MQGAALLLHLPHNMAPIGGLLCPLGQLSWPSSCHSAAPCSTWWCHLAATVVPTAAAYRSAMHLCCPPAECAAMSAAALCHLAAAVQLAAAAPAPVWCLRRGAAEQGGCRLLPTSAHLSCCPRCGSPLAAQAGSAGGSWRCAPRACECPRFAAPLCMLIGAAAACRPWRQPAAAPLIAAPTLPPLVLAVHGAGWPA